jgi:hypothetical protein
LAGFGRIVSPRIGLGLSEGKAVPGTLVDPAGNGVPIEIPSDELEIPVLIGVSYEPITVSP